jgi:hypothetical protein
MKDYSEFLKKHIEENNIKVLNRIFNTDIELKEFVLNNTSNLDNVIDCKNLFVRMYHWYYNIPSIPICEICGTEKKFKTFNIGYKCKQKCERQSDYNKNLNKFKELSKEKILLKIQEILKDFSFVHLSKVFKNNKLDAEGIYYFSKENSKCSVHIREDN